VVSSNSCSVSPRQAIEASTTILLSVSALVKPLRHLRFRSSFLISALLHLWRDVLRLPSDLIWHRSFLLLVSTWNIARLSYGVRHLPSSQAWNVPCISSFSFGLSSFERSLRYVFVQSECYLFSCHLLQFFASCSTIPMVSLVDITPEKLMQNPSLLLHNKHFSPRE